jgi:hypothetical protein
MEDNQTEWDIAVLTEDLLGKAAAKGLRVRLSLVRSGDPPLQTVEIVAVIAGEHVEMIVPDLLIPGRLVVLTKGRAIAPVAVLHRDSNPFPGRLHLQEEVVWDAIDVLVMLIGDN